MSLFELSVLFVKKLNDNLYLYINYHTLNRMTIKNRYPIPLTSEIMNKIKKTTRFIRINILNIFHKIHIAKNNEEKTVFHI